MKRLAIPLVMALLAVPTCASTPVYPRPAALPAFPLAVPSTAGPVPVVLVRHLSRCGEKADPRLVWYGCYHYGPPRFIEIEDTLSPVVKWRTLWHERVHMALAIDGATLKDGDAENAVAEAITKQEIHALLMGWPR